MATETKGVGQRCIYFAFLRFIECEIQFAVDFGIIVSLGMVDSGGYDTVIDRFHTDEGL